MNSLKISPFAAIRDWIRLRRDHGNDRLVNRSCTFSKLIRIASQLIRWPHIVRNFRSIRADGALELLVLALALSEIRIVATVMHKTRRSSTHEPRQFATGAIRLNPVDASFCGPNRHFTVTKYSSP
jgi:hypothetical protein